MKTFLSKIGIILAKIMVVPTVYLLGIAGYHFNQPIPQPQVIIQQVPATISSQKFGATVPITTAFYTDSLQAGISPTATTMTLVKGFDGEGNNLNGAYGFVLDQGTASQEIVFCSTVSGINVSNCTRGLDLTTGTTSVTALEQTHNRGASVQITTAPITNILANIVGGRDSIPLPIYYDPSVSTSTLGANPQYLASVAYSNFVGTSGCANASTGVRGCVQIATAVQSASSTGTGSSGALLVVPSSISTSTPTVAGLNNVMSLNDGKLSPNWLNGTGENYTFNASTTLAATTTIIANGTTTSPLKLNSLSYGFPSTQAITQPATTTLATTYLSNDGKGDLGWNISDWQLIASSTIPTGGLASTTLSFSPRHDIMIMFTGTIVSGGAGVLSMQFNNDSGNNYAWALDDIISGSQSANTTNIIRLVNSTTGPTSGGELTADITVSNFLSIRKTATWTALANQNGGAAGVATNVGSGVWNNQSAQITSITFGAGAGGATLGAGSNIAIYGSAQ